MLRCMNGETAGLLRAMRGKEAPGAVTTHAPGTARARRRVDSAPDEVHWICTASSTTAMASNTISGAP